MRAGDLIVNVRDGRAGAGQDLGGFIYTEDSLSKRDFPSEKFNKHYTGFFFLFTSNG